jgi:hypothetical protein
VHNAYLTNNVETDLVILSRKGTIEATRISEMYILSVLSAYCLTYESCRVSRRDYTKELDSERVKGLFILYKLR